MSEEIKTEIDNYVKFISALSGVLQIYLFGSHASGASHEASDIDLMILVENSKDPFKTAYTIRKGLSETDYPIDIVVNRISAFEEASEIPSFQKTIKENGVLLYAS